MLLFMSNWASNYEYAAVAEEYEKVHDKVSKKVGHHIDRSKKPKNARMKKE